MSEPHQESPLENLKAFRDHLNRRIAELELEACERCSGTGEVEGYGGNSVYCGWCVGTGKKPNSKSEGTVVQGVDWEAGQHLPQCARWVKYDENHKRYVPENGCTCGAESVALRTAKESRQ